MVKAVVLAAGKSSRMKPFSETKPKGMLPVLNKPLLEWLVLNAREEGVNEFIFVVGHKQEVIRSYFGGGSRFGVKINYVNQEEQLGTAHALALAENFVEGEEVLVFSQDVFLSREDIRKMIIVGNLIGVARSDDFKTNGQVLFKEGGVLDRIIEKSSVKYSDFINAGVYHFTANIFDYIKKIKKSERGEYELTDAINLFAKHEVIGAVSLEDCFEITYPWDLLDLNKKLLNGIKGNIQGVVEEGVVLKGGVVIGEGTVVKSGSYIEGPVVIGKNCKIGPNCYIKPYTVIGDGCHVGAASEVKASIVMNDSKIPHHNYVGDSVIGENCNLGSGTKLANLRFDKKNIKVNLDGRVINSNKRKLGSFLADGVQTGVNSIFLPGTSVSPGLFIFPGMVVSGYYKGEGKR